VVFGITSDAAVFSEYKISDEAVVVFKNVRYKFLLLLIAVVFLDFDT